MDQARRQLNWNGGGMDSQYKLLSDQAAFIKSPKTSLANYWGALPPCPPVSTGLCMDTIQDQQRGKSYMSHRKETHGKLEFSKQGLSKFGMLYQHQQQC